MKTKIGLVIAIIFATIFWTLALSSTTNGGQSALPSQISLQNETPIPKPPNTSTRAAVTHKEGYDDKTGWPIGVQGSMQEPIVHGTQSVYPYTANIRTGVKGDVSVKYNYVLQSAQLYLLNIEVINLSDKLLEELQFDQILSNGAGTILNETRDEKHHNSVQYGFPLLPGKSTIIPVCYTSTPPGFHNETEIETWKVEVEVTRLVFQ